MTIFEVTRKNSILRVLRIEVLKFYECRKINTKKLNPNQTKTTTQKTNKTYTIKKIMKTMNNKIKTT